jgi:alpha-tubulin suppressor-like RCC1 family protein
VAAVVSAGTAPAAVAAPGPGVFAFGSNEFGGPGDGTTADSCSPVPVSGLPGPVRQIAVGGATSAALLSDGTVWAWGDNIGRQDPADQHIVIR